MEPPPPPEFAHAAGHGIGRSVARLAVALLGAPASCARLVSQSSSGTWVSCCAVRLGGGDDVGRGEDDLRLCLQAACDDLPQAVSIDGEHAALDFPC